MAFFKKKRFSEVEGYERISRLIEDRQRELAGDNGPDMDEDDPDEETVVLSPSSRPPRPERTEPSETSVMLPRTPSARMIDADLPVRAERMEPSAPVTVAPSPYMPVPDVTMISGSASLVSRDAVWEGKLTCSGDVRIEGAIEGEIETSGTLFVAAEARVHGQVRARSVMLAGSVEGQIRCEQRLEILPGGSARGEIDTGTLVVHEGAFIESKFQMHNGTTGAARL